MQQIVLLKDNWDYALVIINGLLVIGVVVSILVFWYTKRKDKTEKSIELARYYKDNVIANLSKIILIKQAIGIADIFDNKDIKKMIEFDQTERDELFTEKERDAISKATYDKKNIPNVLTINKNFNLKLDGISYVCDDKGTEAKVVIDNRVLQRCIDDLEINVLNSLEYFAMYFNEGLTNEKTVVESLRPTYLKVVKYLYYTIADNNKRGAKEKYYTHVVKLFKKWLI